MKTRGRQDHPRRARGGDPAHEIHAAIQGRVFRRPENAAHQTGGAFSRRDRAALHRTDDRDDRAVDGKGNRVSGRGSLDLFSALEISRLRQARAHQPR